jgi:hypothetical protein
MTTTRKTKKSKNTGNKKKSTSKKRVVRSRQEILKEKIIVELVKNPIKETVCRKLNVPRSTLYRWMNEDYDFKREVIKATKVGNDVVNDLAKSKLIEAIKNGDSGMIKYQLSRRHHEYADKWFSVDLQENKTIELSEEKKAEIAKNIKRWEDMISGKDNEDEDKDEDN